MAGRDYSKEKSRVDYEQRQHQRTLRRNQIIFAVFSAFLIVSMLISLIHW